VPPDRLFFSVPNHFVELAQRSGRQEGRPLTVQRGNHVETSHQLVEVRGAVVPPVEDEREVFRLHLEVFEALEQRIESERLRVRGIPGIGLAENGNRLHRGLSETHEVEVEPLLPAAT
jgi:hypothetical protein